MRYREKKSEKIGEKTGDKTINLEGKPFPSMYYCSALTQLFVDFL